MLDDAKNGCVADYGYGNENLKNDNRFR